MRAEQAKIENNLIWESYARHKFDIYFDWFLEELPMPVDRKKVLDRANYSIQSVHPHLSQIGDDEEQQFYRQALSDALERDDVLEEGLDFIMDTELKQRACAGDTTITAFDRDGTVIALQSLCIEIDDPGFNAKYVHDATAGRIRTVKSSFEVQGPWV